MNGNLISRTAHWTTHWTKLAALVLAGAVLTGCGTTIRSNVTTFHEWPQQLPANTYVFERTREQDKSLEYRNYENLVRAELNRLGLVEASPAVTPALKTSIQYGMKVRDVREVYPVVINQHWHNPAWRLRHGPFYDPFYNSLYDPFYDPFWYGPPIVQQRETTYQIFTRQLRITISRFADDRRLYETTVVSEGQNGSLASVMPYLVRSAFKDFPGPSGVTRQVDIKVQ